MKLSTQERQELIEVLQAAENDRRRTAMLDFDSPSAAMVTIKASVIWQLLSRIDELELYVEHPPRNLNVGLSIQTV